MPVSPLPTRPATAEPAAPAARWRLRVLGGFELDDGQLCLNRLRSRAAMALVARLAMAPARDHPREELATLLWPEADAETGRSRLRQTLSMLRTVLEPAGAAPLVLADRRALRCAPGALWCDALAFEQALARGAAAEALALYRGELLPGFYDEWIQDERLRLAALHDRAETVVAAAPPPPAAATPTHNLPHYLTRLIGADQAGARLLALVGAQRLVTVLGPGGGGKTRLAVEVAQHALAGGRFDGAVFVSLVDTTDRIGLHDRLLQALRLSGGGDAVAQLRSALAGRQLLLVLDNAEQLDDGAVQALAALAEQLPQVHGLVTSRRPLGIEGEQGFALDALALPAADDSLPEVALNPAVALLADRARAHRADFQVTEPQRAALVALVHALEGLPLALELAAAQLRTQGPAALLALLQAARAQPGGGTLDYLARRGPRAGSDPRHASMRAVVEGSWRLLDEGERALLVALATLPAGAPAPLAAVLAGGLPPLQVQARLDALVAQSVLRAQAGASGTVRYAPYEPVREFALEAADAATRAVLRGRLLDGLLAWARQLPETPPLPAVREELPAITQALAQAAADARADDAASLVLLLQSSWGEMALPGGVLAALDSLLAAPALDPTQAAGCHALAGTRHQEGGRPDDARRHRDLALQRLAGATNPDPAVQVMVLGRCARLFWRLDRDHARARALVDEALPVARAHGRVNSEGSLLSLQAVLAGTVDRDPQRATALAEQSLALWRRSGNRHLVNAGRFNVATNRMKSGRHAEVLEEFAELAAEGRELQDWDLAAGALEARGIALLGLRRWAEAEAELQEAVRLAWAGMEPMALVYALWNLAPALARRGRATLAAQTMGAAEALWQQRFGAFDAGDRRDLRRMRRFACVQLGPAAAQSAWAAGAALPLADAVRTALTALTKAER